MSGDNETINALQKRVEELELERAKLLVERDVRSGQRLLDGTRVAVGQRVVLVREACERSHMAHAHDDLVHEITSTLGRDTGLVECGPLQIWTGHLRLAPPGSAVTCPHCAGHAASMSRLRADSDSYRRCQVAAIYAAAREWVPKRALEEFDQRWYDYLDAVSHVRRERDKAERTILDLLSRVEPSRMLVDRLRTARSAFPSMPAPFFNVDKDSILLSVARDGRAAVLSLGLDGTDLLALTVESRGTPRDVNLTSPESAAAIADEIRRHLG